MDSPIEAHAIASELGINVIDRRWSPAEGRQWDSKHPSYLPPATYASLLMDEDRLTWKYVLNEPSPTGREGEFTAWVVSVASILNSNGYKCVVGNFAVGAYPVEAVMAGKYDELIRYCHTYRDKCVLGIHEYAQGTLYHFGAQGATQLGRFENRPYHFSDDPTNNWFLFRCKAFGDRAEQLGLKSPRIIITEFGHDRMGDGGSELHRQVITQFCGEDWQGTYSLAPYWDWFFYGQPFEKSLSQQLQWALDEYARLPYVEGLLLFTWKAWGTDWYNKGYKFSTDSQILPILQGLQDKRVENGAVDMPYNVTGAVVKGAAPYTNVRAEPTTASQVLWQLPPAPTYAVVLDSVQANDGIWVKYCFITPHIIGWVRDDVHTVMNTYQLTVT